MKIKELKEVMVLIIVLLWLSACGGLKVGLDDETIGATDCLLNDNCEDGGSDSSDGDDSSDNGSDNEQGEGTNDDDEETGGGVVVEEYERAEEAYFLGTYQAVDFNADYWMVADKCEYNFPKIIRGYSHGDEIDFETQEGDLAFSAMIYPDETFDFPVTFQNTLGQPTVEVTCTCEIWESDNDYYSDEIQCGCQNDERDLCLMYWEAL